MMFLDYLTFRFFETDLDEEGLVKAVIELNKLFWHNGYVSMVQYCEKLHIDPMFMIKVWQIKPEKVGLLVKNNEFFAVEEIKIKGTDKKILAIIPPQL